ncbi:unnamed protein product [Notodromas monacha]|uniref:Methylated-DNA--protein-cysteine methyltransferase n=1 Tax=Notodromas monacha TaxID=399045 RepID=A0A7R9BVD6_9CRUS|nr:unnamed protein product [Notodromas monacha]CAG0921386.1 unnamed protein product [Notodromas monacha]
MTGKTATCLSGAAVTSHVVASPIGRIFVSVCRKGIHSIHLEPAGVGKINDAEVELEESEECGPPDAEHVMNAVNWLKHYFVRCSPECEQPGLCLEGHTDFRVKVWLSLKDGTKRGDRISYKELARLAGVSEKSSRAVGQAMANNPFLLLVPCHRVILSSGKIGHYSSGKRDDVKRYLLELELH